MRITADLLERAMQFSIQAHHGQKRKGDGRPYIMHPLAVMNLMRDIKDSSNAVLLGIAAVLHDVVEDCEIPVATIEKMFGQKAASIVSELTSDPIEVARVGKTGYLCLKMEKMSTYALALKLCDRYDNVKDLEKMPKKFRNQYVKETTIILKYIMTMRKLTRTHKKLIKLIQERLEPWTKEMSR